MEVHAHGAAALSKEATHNNSTHSVGESILEAQCVCPALNALTLLQRAREGELRPLTQRENEGERRESAHFLGWVLIRVYRVPPVQAAILYSLEHYCHEDAVFLAERLYDEGECTRRPVTCVFDRYLHCNVCLCIQSCT